MAEVHLQVAEVRAEEGNLLMPEAREHLTLLGSFQMSRLSCNQTSRNLRVARKTAVTIRIPPHAARRRRRARAITVLSRDLR